LYVLRRFHVGHGIGVSCPKERCGSDEYGRKRQKETVYIELQKVSSHHLRLVYIEKLLYEKYKDFLRKTYEPYGRKKSKKDWMDNL